MDMMMGMSIRELDVFMFSTFLGLMNLAQGDVKYSPKKEVDGASGKKKHMFFHFYVYAPQWTRVLTA